MLPFHVALSYTLSQKTSVSGVQLSPCIVKGTTAQRGQVTHSSPSSSLVVMTSRSGLRCVNHPLIRGKEGESVPLGIF